MKSDRFGKIPSFQVRNVVIKHLSAYLKITTRLKVQVNKTYCLCPLEYYRPLRGEKRIALSQSRPMKEKR